MTTPSLISETFNDGGCSPEQPMSLFAPLSISGEKNGNGSGATKATDENSYVESAEADIRVALENLIDMHQRLENEKELVESRYKHETVRWLSGIVSGIAPRLSRALVYSTIDEIAARAFMGGTCGQISIRMNPKVAVGLRGSYPELNRSPQILIQEDGKQPELTVLAEWDGGRLAFDAAEAIKTLDLLLAQSIVKQEFAECPNEVNHAK